MFIKVPLKPNPIPKNHLNLIQIKIRNHIEDMECSL